MLTVTNNTVLCKAIATGYAELSIEWTCILGTVELMRSRL
jgi:hypothetical protein